MSCAVGISSIHLLKTFIEVGDLGASNSENVTGEVYTWDGVLWQVIIHMVFIVSAVALAWIDKISHTYAAGAVVPAAPAVGQPAPSIRA